MTKDVQGLPVLTLLTFGAASFFSGGVALCAVRCSAVPLASTPVCQGPPPPEPHACRLQVVEKIPLPFFAVSMSLSPGAHLVAIGFSGEWW